MKKDIGSNYLYNLIYQILLMITPLITTPYISRNLGAEGIGLYSYSYSIVTYFTLFQILGTTMYGEREIAYNKDDYQKMGIIFWNIVSFRFITTIICLIVYIIYIMHFSKDFIVALLQMGYILAVPIDITWFFRGQENFKEVVIRNIAIKVLNISSIFIFIKNQNDLYKYIAILAFFPLIGYVVMWSKLPCAIFKIDRKRISPHVVLRGAFSLFVPMVAVQIYVVLDKVMIGMFAASLHENGYYEQAEKIVKLSLTIITTIGTVMAPRIAGEYAKKQINKIQNYLYASFRYVFLMGIPIILGMAAVSDMIVPWFLGSGFYKCIGLIKILSLLVLAIGLSNVCAIQYLIPVGKQNVFTFSTFSGAVINFFLNCLLIPKYYSVGAAFASVLAETAVALIGILYMAFIDKIIKLAHIFYHVPKYLSAGIIMYLTIINLKRFVLFNVGYTFLMIVVGALVYFAILFLFNDDFEKKIINTLWQLLSDSLRNIRRGKYE